MSDKTATLLAACVLLTWPAAAQPRALTMAEAVRTAVEKYPALEAARQRAAAAAAGVRLARTSYLPRADFLAQINRATRNNVFGLLLPQPLPVLSSISGPVLGTNGLESVWGSAAGVLVAWEPFDFGWRRSNLEAAQAAGRRAVESVEVERLEIGTRAAEAFLQVLAAEEGLKAAEAGVQRARVFYEATAALVRAELRPGADQQRAAAELAAAEMARIRAQEAREMGRAELGQWLGLPAREIAVEAGRLLDAPPPEIWEHPAVHPALREQNAAIEEAQARVRWTERARFPRFLLEGTSYGRGSGARTDGSRGGPWSGLGPNFHNWAVGISVTFPLLELPALAARRAAEVARQEAEQQRYRELAQQQQAAIDKARVQWESARRVAEQTPGRVAAARAVEQQALARYRAGLATALEVADAQRLLTQAETEDALARVGVWRALLVLAAAQGDLEPFLRAAER